MKIQLHEDEIKLLIQALHTQLNDECVVYKGKGCNVCENNPVCQEYIDLVARLELELRDGE